MKSFYFTLCFTTKVRLIQVSPSSSPLHLSSSPSSNSSSPRINSSPSPQDKNFSSPIKNSSTDSNCSLSPPIRCSYPSPHLTDLGQVFSGAAQVLPIKVEEQFAVSHLVTSPHS